MRCLVDEKQGRQWDRDAIDEDTAPGLRRILSERFGNVVRKMSLVWVSTLDIYFITCGLEVGGVTGGGGYDDGCGDGLA